MMRRLLLVSVLGACAPLVSAQALLEPPPPPPSEVERQVAEINSVPQLAVLAQRYQAAADWRNYAAVTERMLVLRPQAGRLRYELSAAYASLGNMEKAYDALLKLQTAGWGFDPKSDPRFRSLHGVELWGHINAGLDANRAPFGSGKVAFELPAEDWLVETIAYDPARTEFLLGTVRTGEVLRADARGKTRAFIKPDAENGLYGVLDLALDAERDVLWVATAAMPHVKHVKAEDYGLAALVKFQLSTGKLLERAPLPGDGNPHVFASVASNGRSVFVADVTTNRVLQYGAGGYNVVMQHPKITALRGLTLSGDGKLLYFADHEQGIFGIDLGTGAAFDMRHSPNASVFGIDALYWYDDTLIAVQNGMNPRRVIRYSLDKSGRVIRRIQTLDGARPELSAPTRGTIAGERFYFIANSQKNRYDRYGIPVEAGKFERVRVFESDARFAIDLDRGEIRNAPK
jgi:sugar lactone lactonase YvrE